MRKDTTCCLLLSFLVFFNPVSMANVNYDDLIDNSFKKRRAGFANLEHRKIGNQVVLRWGDLPHSLDNNQVELTNKLVLSYGELIMFAGDLFGSQKYPVSECPAKNQPYCFYQQFSALDRIKHNPFQNALIQIPTYRSYLSQLSHEINQAKSNGINEWQFYFKHGSDISKHLNRLSGGGSIISDYIPFGEYIKLAKVNYDHFVPGAITAYQAGHKLALQTAISAHEAYNAGNPEKAYQFLSRAYAMNGFANHYLTDAMSSGHFRTPRKEIAANVYLPKVLCLLIANLMHDEDNRIGLNVTNQRGISWRAYGDGFLGTPDASQHLNLIKQIVQESADAVFRAFESGQMPEKYEELSLLPDYNLIGQLNNHSPLFKWENNQLLKRKNNFDANDHRYTAWWSGVITLVKFNQHNWDDETDGKS